MFINVNTIKCCACETLNLVQSSISMNVKLLQYLVVQVESKMVTLCYYFFNLLG